MPREIRQDSHEYYIRSGIFQLPPEIMRKIFDFLEPPDCLRASLVCRMWHDVADFRPECLQQLLDALRECHVESGRPPTWHEGLPDDVDVLHHDLSVQISAGPLRLSRLIAGGFGGQGTNSPFQDHHLGTITQWFTNLQELQLQNCKNLTEAGIVTCLTSGVALRRLKVQYCNALTDDLLLGPSRSPVLQETVRLIELVDNDSMTDAALVHAAQFERLGKLVLKGRFGDQGLALLDREHKSGRLSRLSCLHLYRCEGLTDAGLIHLAALRPLRKLSLMHSNDIFNRTDALLPVAASKIVFLDLALSRVRDSDAAHISRLQNLRKLSVTETGIGIQFVADLVGSRIECLDLTACANLSNEALLHVAKMTSLRKLNLSHCWNVGGEGYRNLVRGGSRIESLVVHGFEGDDAAPLSRLSALRRLTVSGAKIGQRFLRSLSSGTPSGIAVLQLEQCWYVGDKGVQHLAGLPKLRRINLSGTKITAAGLLAVLRDCEGITELDVRGCKGLGSDTLEVVAGCGPGQLRVLKLGKGHVLEKDLASAAAALPALQYLEVGSQNRTRDVRSIQKREGPGIFHGSARSQQLGGRAENAGASTCRFL